MPVRLEPASVVDKPLLSRLMQLYLHDLSEYLPDLRIAASGLFPYEYFNHYWTEEGLFPYLIGTGAEVAGFALVRALDDGFEMAEFFVLRSHRRVGMGRAAATEAFHLHPGVWAVRYATNNDRAAPFWLAVCEASAAPGSLTRVSLPDNEAEFRFNVGA